MKNSALLVLGLIPLSFFSCKKDEEAQKDFLKNLTTEITVVDEDMMSEFGTETEGSFIISSSSTAIGYHYQSVGTTNQLNGIVFQNLTNHTPIDAGTFYASDLETNASTVEGIMCYSQIDNPVVKNIYGKSVEFKLMRPMIAVPVFSFTLEIPSEIFISAPVSDPLSSGYSNTVTTSSTLTWNNDATNKNGVLVEIQDAGLQNPVTRIITPDDGSLSFSDLWSYLPTGNFSLTIKRGNWKTVASGLKNYRVIVHSSSTNGYYK